MRSSQDGWCILTIVDREGHQRRRTGPRGWRNMVEVKVEVRMNQWGGFGGVSLGGRRGGRRIKGLTAKSMGGRVKAWLMQGCLRRKM